MTRRNFYYFDRSSNQVSFLAITSNGYVSTGTVIQEDSTLAFGGRQVRPDGSVYVTRSLWEFQSEGNIRVIGYRKENNNWLPGHRILYTAAGSD